MNRETAFSYTCSACGICCHDKMITLSPYDVLRIARAAGITTGAAIRSFTIRRGSILRFAALGACVARAGTRCTLHAGRPLACRLYPLGLERDGQRERFVRLDPAPGSPEIYGAAGTVGEFLAQQETEPYLRANGHYSALIPWFRARVFALVDFERVEPREFWREAVREAAAESGFDPNPIIDAMFDADSVVTASTDEDETIASHQRALGEIATIETDPGRIAAAAVALAMSLGYAPGYVIGPPNL